MRLLHYNVLFDDIHLQLLEDIVLQVDPDILTLNEVQPEEIERLQKWYKTAFVESARRQGAPQGNAIAWKPALSMQSFHSVREGLKTPLLEWVPELGSTEGFSVYVLHLAAKEGEQHRLQEIKTILAQLPQQGDYILTGDFNSLSPHDGYDLAQLEANMRKYDHQKFGIPVQFLVVPFLEQQGLVDLQRRSGILDSTVPTKEGTPESELRQHFQPLRLDYFFATPGLAEKVSRTYVLKNALTEKCSDHYPIVVEFEF